MALLGDMYKDYVSSYGENPFDISRERLSKDINEVTRLAGVGTSHAFRRTKITAISMEKGIVMANQFIGHRQLETTKRYVLSTLGRKERRYK